MFNEARPSPRPKCAASGADGSNRSSVGKLPVEMALVTRLLKPPDNGGTHIFTFVGTKSVTRDLNRNIYSKEFRFGHQTWTITLVREEKNLSVYLVWKNISEACWINHNYLLIAIFHDLMINLDMLKHFLHQIPTKENEYQQNIWILSNIQLLNKMMDFLRILINNFNNRFFINDGYKLSWYLDMLYFTTYLRRNTFLTSIITTNV